MCSLSEITPFSLLTTHEVKMTNQEMFKQELIDLLGKYNVVVSVEEEARGFTYEVKGINFYSFHQDIDLDLGSYIDWRIFNEDK